ncbi:MAG: hypothetical protein KQI81_09695 [Deltaproteobacteria bacterium]|nr:hypothetical protein [Deltaproteobacteria bacterium]
MNVFKPVPPVFAGIAKWLEKYNDFNFLTIRQMACPLTLDELSLSLIAYLTGNAVIYPLRWPAWF